ncbi:MAG: phosphoglucosamine mutase [Candidatus Methanoperedens sp.]|nr:phosphoglucosamine mutase [Candidatus Methanoperedens sp.]
MALFGSSGIRGLANREITPGLALKVGLALGSMHDSAVIGRDPRTSGEMIEYAVISGLLSAGCNVTRVGMVSTPTLAYAARNHDCGVMVTASHNPPEYGGIKLWNRDGMAFDTKQQDEIESVIQNKTWKMAEWNNIGRVNEADVIEEHAELILGKVGRTSLKVVVDCGCGAASTITPYVLRRMGCHVITLNSQPDGFFPARNPEPVEKNLEMLKKATLAFGANLGIAHDGDADRMMAVDGLGRFVEGDKLLAFFGLRETKKSIVVPVDTSIMVDDVLKGRKVYRTRVGDVYVAEELKKRNADFGGEPSGSWIFPGISLCPDGIYAAARLVEIVENEGRLDSLVDELPAYPMVRGTIACSNDKKEAAMRKIGNGLKKIGEVSSIDGIRVDTKEGWILVRPSGTEPKIRITAEARNDVEKLYARAEKIVKEALLGS